MNSASRNRLLSKNRLSLTPNNNRQQQPISDHLMMIGWLVSVAQEFFSGFRLVCKGSCDDHSLPCSMKLDTAIAFLLHHSGINDAALEQACKTAKDMGQF
jgi:hypothetical protein